MRSAGIKCDQFVCVCVTDIVCCVLCVGKWTKISPLLPGRTDNMIMYRYQRMKRCRDAEERLAKIPVSLIGKLVSLSVSCPRPLFFFSFYLYLSRSLPTSPPSLPLSLSLPPISPTFSLSLPLALSLSLSLPPSPGFARTLENPRKPTNYKTYFTGYSKALEFHPKPSKLSN